MNRNEAILALYAASEQLARAADAVKGSRPALAIQICDVAEYVATVLGKIVVQRGERVAS